MLRVTVVLAAVVLLAAGIFGHNAYSALQGRPQFHHMRYCPTPGGTMPMLPCAVYEDPNEVIQA